MSDDGLPRPPANRHSESIERLRRSALDGAGETEPELRQAVALYASQLWLDGASEVAVPAELRGYVDKLTLTAYKVVDSDFDRLDAAGYSEDQVFELTVAAALGCGLRALECGLSASRRS